MVDDLNVLLEQLDLQSCHVLGWSDGGVIGLLLALKHPSKVSKLAIVGARLRPDGLHDWAPDCIKSELAQYDLMISQGDQSKPWRTIKQVTRLIIEGPHIPTFRLKTLRTPTLVMAADKDVVRDEHTLEIFHGLPNAHLCILPGLTHRLVWENPSLVNQMVDSFFQTPFDRPDTKDYWIKPTDPDGSEAN